MQAKQKVPRASFSITLLDDEDFRILMSDKCGTSSLGVFLALTLVGRRRLLDRRASRIEGTDALVIENSVDHTLHLACVRRKDFDAFLAAMKIACDQTGTQPWVYVDDDGRIVIRSFFKFNAHDNHGGRREGAGRKSSGNQVDSSGNQGGTTCFPSLSYSLSSSVCVLDSDTRTPASTSKPAEQPTRHDPDDEPFLPPSSTIPITPPASVGIGRNPPDEVAATLALGREVDPMGDLDWWVRTWLADHPAEFVRECLRKSRGKVRPSSYAATLIRNGPGPAAPPRRPEPERPEDRILRAKRPAS